MGLFDKVKSAAEAAIQAFNGQVTQKPYSPSAVMGRVDGSRYGSDAAHVNAIRECEDYAIAVVRLAEAISSLKHKVTKAGGKTDIVDKKHPFLALLDKPNELSYWEEWIEVLVFHLIGAGNMYILKAVQSMAGTPMQLWILRPDMTRPIKNPDPTLPIIGYEHYNEDGICYRFKAEDVIHIKLPNPVTQYIGLSRIEMMDATLNMDYATQQYNWNYFKNNASLGTILETEGQLTDDLKKQLIKQFNEMHSGWKNAHRTAVLDNGLKVNEKAGTTSPKETDYAETRKGIRIQVGGLMGVPEIKMGVVENANRSNSTTQNAIFYADGVKPLAKRLARGINQIAKDFGVEFQFAENVQRDDETMATVAQIYFGLGALTPNQIVTQFLGNEASKKPGMDSYYLPLNFFPIGEDQRAEDAEDVDDKDDRPTKAVIDAEKRMREAFKKAMDMDDEEPQESFPEGTAVQRRVLKFLATMRGGSERRLKRLYSEWFKSFGESAARYVAEKKSLEGYTIKGFAGVVYKSIIDGMSDDQKRGLVRFVLPTYGQELTAQYQDIADLFSIEAKFEEGMPNYTQAMDKLAKLVKGIDDDTRKDLERLIQEGFEAGLSPAEIANGTADGEFKGIAETFDEFSKSRSERIALTETVRIQNQSSVAAYKDLGVRRVDVIGCKDFVIMPGQLFGCNSQGIPISQADGVDFHPNHQGAIVPVIESPVLAAKALKLLAEA